MRIASSGPKPKTGLDKPVSRTSCLLAGVVWLCIAILPCFAVALAIRGELSWQRGEFVEDRVWIVNEPDARGVAYSATRLTPAQTAGDTCVRSRVFFLLWRGASESLAYCDCYTARGDGYDYAGSCSP